MLAGGAGDICIITQVYTGAADDWTERVSNDSLDL